MKKGFTLAEVLVTLAIIGIIASITIPNLLNKSNDDGLKTQWKKAFGELSQAYMSILADNGGTPPFNYSVNHIGSEDMKNAFKIKLGYTKDCSGTAAYSGSGTGSSAMGCWHAANNWKYLWGGNYPISSDQPGLILNNGALIIMNASNTSHLGDFAPGGFDAIASVKIDVNGFKGPNVVGKDIFSLHLTTNRLVPDGALGYQNPATTCIIGNTDNGNYGYGCSAKYLYE